ncbi:MAG: hypothetical protein JXA81_01285 [Sedimentisphaerales bacterium]|nr:hypothetical protein [Sedimentisphaerales bacterium]
MMKQNNNKPITELDKNFSRLLKLAGRSNIPSRTFMWSLKNDALDELEQTDIKKTEVKNIAIRSNWLEKTMGWAAMIAAAFGAGLVVIISFFLKMNLLLEVIVVLTIVFNWISSLGGHI